MLNKRLGWNISTIKTDDNILWTEFSEKCLELIKEHVYTFQGNILALQPAMDQPRAQKVVKKETETL